MTKAPKDLPSLEQLSKENESLRASMDEFERAIQALQEKESYARKESARMEAILASLPNAVTIYDRKGRVVRANKLSADFIAQALGNSSDVDLSQVKFTSEQGQPVVPEERPVQKALHGETVRGAILCIQKGTDAPVWISADAAPVYKDGEINGAVLVITDITDFKLLEEEQKQSEKRYRDLVKYAPTAIYELDFRTRKFTSVNDVMCELSGYSREELLAMTPFDILEPESQLRFKERVQKWLAGEKPDEDVEYVVNAKDGRKIHAVLNVKFTRDENGLPLGATVVGYDISERERLEQSLQDIADKYSMIVGSISDGVWIHNMKGRIVEVNDAYCRMSGYKREELISMPVSALEAQENAEEVALHLQRLISEGGHENFQSRHRRKDGSVFDVDITALYLEREGGQIAVFVRDITKQKQVEAALRESRDQYQAMIETTSDFIWETDPNGCYTYCSPQMDALWGLKPKDMLGKTPFDRMPEEDKQAGVVFFRELVAARKPFSGLVTTAINAGGERISIETSGVPFFDAEGNLLGYRGITRDITGRKLAEDALHKSEMLLRAVIDTTQDPVYVKDHQSRILLANQALANIVGKPIEDIIGKTDSEYYENAEIGQALRENDLKVMESKEGLTAEETVLTTEGWRTFLSAKAPYRDPEGQVIGIIGISRDITERKGAEQAIAQARLEAEQRATELQTLMESMPVGLVITRDPQGMVITGNRAAHELLQVPLEEGNISKLAPDPQKVRTYKVIRNGKEIPPEEMPIQRAARNEEVRDWDCDLVFENGEVGHVLVNATPLFDEEGKPRGAVAGIIDMTERKRVEEALRQSEERFRLALKNAPVSVAVQDRNLVFQWAFNQRTVPPEQIIGKTDHDIFAPEDARHLIALKKSVLETGSEVHEKMWITSGGKRVYIDLLLEPLRDAEGNVTGIGIATIDLTATRMAEEELQKSEARFRSTMDGMLEGCQIIGLDWKYIYVNDAAERHNRRPKEEILGKDYREVWPGIETTPAFAAIRDCLGNRVAHSFDNEFTFPDGSVGWFELSIQPVSEGVFMLSVDISERRKQEHDLRRLNRTLKALGAINIAMVRATDEKAYMDEVCRIIVQDCGHAMVWIGFAENDEDKTVRPVANAGFEEGYLDTLHITWADSERGRGPTGTAIRTGQVSMCRNMQVDPKFKPWREEALKRGYASSIVLPLLARGTAFGSLTIYSRSPDGFKDDEIELLKELSSDLAYGISMLRTRQAHDRAEEALRQSEARFRQLADGSFEGLVIHQNSVLVDANTRISEMLDYSTEELIGKPYWIFVDPEDQQQVKEKIQAGSTEQYEIKLIHKDGHKVPVEVVGRPILWKGTQARITALRDISERKKAEAEIRASQEQYRSLFDTLMEGFCIIEVIFDEKNHPVDYRFLEVNPAFERQTGLHDAKGKLMRSFAPDHEEFWFETYGKIALTGEPARFENEARALGRYYEVFAYKVGGAESRKVAIMFNDISERKRAEAESRRLFEAVQEEKDRLSTLVNSISDEVWFADTNAKFTLANPAALEEFGVDVKNPLDIEAFSNSLEVQRPDGSPRPLEETPSLRALKGETVRSAEEIIRIPKLGELRNREVNATPVRDPNGKIIGSVAVVRDITERRKAEEVLKAANDELRRFNRVMTGRELRMLELKKEINELCEKLGLPARYSLDFEMERQ